MNIDTVFTSIQEEINQESNNKSLLNELEQALITALTPLKSEYSKANYLQPLDLSTDFFNAADLEDVTKSVESILPSTRNVNNLAQLAYLHSDFLARLEAIDCKKIQKDRVLHKINEEIIYLLLANRYFKVIAYHFLQEQVVIPMITGDSLGLVMTPEEIRSTLKIEYLEYSDYLLALLKLNDTIVDFTTNSIIKISISSSSSSELVKRQYTISIINSKLITKLENGFKLLDLKNDNIRRKYDGLKYNLKKINSIVYDLSLRKLIITDGEIV